jgi:hypothetical protein
MRRQQAQSVVRIAVSLALAVAGVAAAAWAEPDEEGCKDHPMFSRMNDYYISGCRTKPFDRVELYVGDDETTPIEGKTTVITYSFNHEDGAASELQIVRNYANAVKSLGGSAVYDWGDGGTFKIAKGGREVWVGVACGGGGYSYDLTIIERGAMAQEVTASDMLAALEKDALHQLRYRQGHDSARVAADRRPGRDSHEAERRAQAEHRGPHRQRRDGGRQQAALRATRQGGDGGGGGERRPGGEAVRGGLGSGEADRRQPE